MLRFSPTQIDQLAGMACGDAKYEQWAYRTHAALTDFFAFTGVDVPPDASEPGGSRLDRARAFWRHASSTGPEGESGLSQAAESALVALLDRREFESDTHHRSCVESAREALAGLPVDVLLTGSAIRVVSTKRSVSQRNIDRRFHTVFGESLAESDLRAAREHYRKAEGFLQHAPPDYANVIKESVCCIESIAVALTGRSNIKDALKKAVNEGAIPPTLSQMILRVYDYRGNEPGVAHGSSEVTDPSPAEAWLVFNLASVIGLYLRSALTQETPPPT